MNIFYSKQKKVNVVDINNKNIYIINNLIKKKNFDLKKFDYYFWDFKPNIYKQKYQDLKTFNELQLKQHYFFIGRYERRIYNNGIKILIYCDEWNNSSSVKFGTGGNLALYNLGKLINEKKCENIYAKMYISSRKNKTNPYCNVFANDNEINPRTLVIYTDGTYKNPLFAKNVMRWILLEIGTSYRPLDILKTWESDNLLYHWENSKIATNIKILNTTFMDPIFVNNNLNRKTNTSCYLIKKRKLHKTNILIIHPDKSICIDNLLKNEIVKIFNNVEKFYCYDLNTFLIIGAIICGCKVILVPNNTSKHNYINMSILSNFEKFNTMVAWGESDFENINYTNDDIHKLINYIKTLSNSVDVFLKDIYNYFNSIPVYIPTVKYVYNK